MQMSVAYLWYDFSETPFSWTSSKKVYRLNANRTGTEQHRTDTERERNGYGTDTGRIQNGCRTDAERERERVWNGNRTRSLKRSLLGFFWSVLYYAMKTFWQLNFCHYCSNIVRKWSEIHRLVFTFLVHQYEGMQEGGKPMSSLCLSVESKKLRWQNSRKAEQWLVSVLLYPLNSNLSCG